MTQLVRRLRRHFVSADSLDEEIEENIVTCLLLLQGVGISHPKACRKPEEQTDPESL